MSVVCTITGLWSCLAVQDGTRQPHVYWQHSCIPAEYWGDVNTARVICHAEQGHEDWSSLFVYLYLYPYYDTRWQLSSPGTCRWWRGHCPPPAPESRPSPPGPSSSARTACPRSWRWPEPSPRSRCPGCPALSSPCPACLCWARPGLSGCSYFPLQRHFIIITRSEKIQRNINYKCFTFTKTFPLDTVQASIS